MTTRTVTGMYAQPADSSLREGIENARLHAERSVRDLAKVAGRVLVGEPTMRLVEDVPGIQLGHDVVCLAFDWDTEPLP